MSRYWKYWKFYKATILYSTVIGVILILMFDWNPPDVHHFPSILVIMWKDFNRSSRYHNIVATVSMLIQCFHCVVMLCGWRIIWQQTPVLVISCDQFQVKDWKKWIGNNRPAESLTHNQTKKKRRKIERKVC